MNLGILLREHHDGLIKLGTREGHSPIDPGPILWHNLCNVIMIIRHEAVIRDGARWFGPRRAGAHNANRQRFSCSLMPDGAPAKGGCPLCGLAMIYNDW